MFSKVFRKKKDIKSSANKDYLPSVVHKIFFSDIVFTVKKFESPENPSDETI